MTDGDAKSFGWSLAIADTCGNTNVLTPTQAQQARNQLVINFNSWGNAQDIEIQKLANDEYARIMQIASNGLIPTAMQCQQAYQVVRNAHKQHEINKAKASSTTTSTSVSDYIQCKKIGQFINVEIKTFTGGICPLGWYRA